jgi:hypothetical protein
VELAEAPLVLMLLGLVYAGLLAAVVWILRRLSRAPLELPEEAAGGAR